MATDDDTILTGRQEMARRILESRNVRFSEKDLMRLATHRGGQTHESALELVDQEMLRRHHERYRGMPMAGPDTDPTNTTPERAAEQALKEQLARNAADVMAAQEAADTDKLAQELQDLAQATAAPPNTTAVSSTAATPVGDDATITDSAMDNAATTDAATTDDASWQPHIVVAGVYRDLRQWSSLPCAPTALARCRHTFCRGNRTMFLLAIITILLMVAIILRFIIPQ